MAKTIKIKTIKLFLASSSELKEDREQFALFISSKNKYWVNNKGIFLELSHWEDFLEAFSRTRLQDEYNKAVEECDIFVMLFFTKVGKYTKEEFERAFGQFKATNKPCIFTYFKDTAVSSSSIKAKDQQSVEAFKKKLRDLGHFQSIYKDINELKYKFSEQLDKLAALNFTKCAQDKTEPEQNAAISISPRLSDDGGTRAETVAPTRKKTSKPSKSQTYPSSDQTSNLTAPPNNPPKANRGDENKFPRYLGLDPYKPEDSEYFFGRKKEIDQLISLISDSVQMLHIRGGSGVGKSSLVLAGLLPRLGKTDNNGMPWDSLSFKPGPDLDPFLSLATPLNKRIRSGERLDDVGLADKMYSDNKEFIDSLRNGIKLRCEPARRILYIDQLEELLLHTQDDTEEQRKEQRKKQREEQRARCYKFVECLSEFLKADPRNLLITSIRTDRDDLRDLPEWNALRTMINAGRQYTVVVPEEADGISDIVSGPADLAQFIVESELIAALRIDMKGLTNWTPLLSVALEDIVDHWCKHPADAPKRCLTLKLYQAIGGLNEVIERRAKKATAGLSEKERNEVLPNIFPLLVRLDDRGEPAKRRYIGSKVKLSSEEQKVLNSLIKAPLLVEEGGVEIIHDVLFRRWKDLDKWIKIKKEDLDELSELEHQAKRWRRRGEREIDLLGKDRIKRAEEALEQHQQRIEELPILKDFVANSRSLRDQEALVEAIRSGNIFDVYRLIRRNVKLRDEQIAALADKNIFYYSLFPEAIPVRQIAGGTGIMARLAPDSFKKTSESNAGISQAQLDFFKKDNIRGHVNNNFTVQHFAALAGHVDLLVHFETLGAKMSAVSDNGNDVLVAAAYGGRLDALKWLATRPKLPKNILTRTRGKIKRSPIHGAALMGQSEIVQYLIEQGAHVKEVDHDGYSVLDSTVYYGNPEVVKILLDRGADPGRIGPGWRAPLQLAIENGEWNSARSLLDNAPAEKLRINNISNYGTTALGAAVDREAIDLEVVRRLLEAGANPNPEAGKGIVPPLVLATIRGHKSIVDLLIEKQADVNLPDTAGQTALHHAVRNDHWDIWKSLLACSAIEVDLPDSKGVTPLFHAAHAGNEEVVNALLDKGAKANRNFSGGVFIVEAAAHGTDLLTAAAHGADPLTRVARGRIAERLVAAGAPMSPWREFDRDEIERVVGLRWISGSEWWIPPIIDGPWLVLDKDASAQILARFAKMDDKQEERLRTVAIADVRTIPLSIYLDGHVHVYEVSVLRGDGLQGYLTFLETAGGFVPIDGNSTQIHELNKKQNLSLETAADAATYLRFFCSSLSAEEGVFRIFERAQYLLPLGNPGKAEEDAQRRAAPLKFESAGHDETGQFFMFSAAVKYSNAIFEAKFKVQQNGFVEMLEDTAVVQNLNVYVEIFNDGIRTIQAPSKNTDENTDKSPSPEDSG